jgi:putative phage-type endonuclease
MLLEECQNKIIQLENIIESFDLPQCFNESEILELTETAASLINELINSNPMIYIEPTFQETIIAQVSDLLEKQLSTLYDFDIRCDIEEIVSKGLSFYYGNISPKRSYKNSFVRKKCNYDKLKPQIKYLQNVPQPEQRTTEWYNFRHSVLTASSIWKAFISESTRNQLIYDKCSPIDIDKYKRFSTASPMHWGQKYEPVSIEWYEQKYKTKVSDFGCIPHKTISFLAASPDGINTSLESERYGRMLEVKNIVNRDITGIPKMEYWIQMQMQMEVCELNECDFLETRFKEYESKEEFVADCCSDDNNVYSKTKDDKYKGVIMYFIKDGAPHYEYAPLGINKSNFEEWESEIMDKYKDLTWIKNIYWRLDEISCVLVLRNKLWFKTAEPILRELWNIIENEKITGYNHRAPKRNIKNTNANTNTNTTSPGPERSSKCLINIDNLLNNNAESKNNIIISNQSQDNNGKDIVFNINTEILSETKLDS